MCAQRFRDSGRDTFGKSRVSSNPISHALRENSECHCACAAYVSVVIRKTVTVRGDANAINDREVYPQSYHRDSDAHTRVYPALSLATRQGPVELRIDYLILCFANHCKAEPVMAGPWRSSVIVTVNYHMNL